MGAALREGGVDLVTDRRRVKLCRAGSGDDHDVVPRRVAGGVAAEDIPQHASDAIALHGVAHLAAGHEAEPRGIVCAPIKEDHGEMRGVMAPAALLRAEELHAAADPMGAWQPLGARRRVRAHFS